MSEQDDLKPVESRTVRAAKQIDRALEKTAGAAKAALKKIGQFQSGAGDDYAGIFATNPLVVESLARAPLLIENKELLSTALNVQWMTNAVWLAATSSTTVFNHSTSRALGGMFHYGPGHVRHWAEVNRFMDSVHGSGHRLKFGHSIEFLPQITEKFGIDGVPAYFCHLLQDFTTPDGIPVLPHSWAIKQNLHLLGIPAKLATGLVSLSAANVLAVSMIATLVWKHQKQRERDNRRQKLLVSAESATENLDYAGAIECYKRSLELKRDPTVLTALGQIYLRRTATRPYAHRAFAEVVQMLGAEADKTVPCHGAQLSLRGIAGLQALATADVIGDRYPEYWQEQVDSLVNATVHSFGSTAAQLEEHSQRRAISPVARPALFSAAINRYLAAQTACQYPLLDNRQELVGGHVRGAIGLLGRVGQHHEATLREPVEQLCGVWVRAVLPEEEADLMLATA